MKTQQPLPRRILLTGASGYLGQHVLRAVLTTKNNAQVEIVALANRATAPLAMAVHQMMMATTEAAGGQHCQVTVQSLDLTNAAAVRSWFQVFKRFDVCVHIAAMSIPQHCHDRPQMAAAINVPTVFFQELVRRGCRIVAVSTDQVYSGEQAPHQEDMALGPVNTYGATKMKMEQVLQRLQPSCVILRSSLILGPLAPFVSVHDTFLHFCASRHSTATDFYVDQRRSAIAVHDVVATILFAITSPDSVMSGVYNMGGPDSVSRMDIAQAVFAHLGYDPKLLVARHKVGVHERGLVHTPLDSSMDSSKLHHLMQNTIQHSFMHLHDMVASTFPHYNQEKEFGVPPGIPYTVLVSPPSSGDPDPSPTSDNGKYYCPVSP